MVIGKETRITLIVVAGVVIISLAGLAVLSGATLDVVAILKSLGVLGAGIATGIGIAGGRPS